MEYLVKSSAIILIFYLFYSVFLRSETYFKTMRWFFLTGLLLSLTLPIIVVTKYVEAVPNLTTETYMVTESEIVQSSTLNTEMSLNLYQILLLIYVLGVTVFIIAVFWLQLRSLALLLFKHPIIKEGGYLFLRTDKAISPFSFFNYIVYNPNQFKTEELKQIIKHEKVHARHLHSIDTILIHLFAIFQWCNPFIWLYKKELEQNLEFMADDITQQEVESKKDYQQLILKTSVPNYQLVLANNFYNSILKKRIFMLHKERSTNASQWKLVLITPILLAFLVVFNTKTIAQTSDSDNEIIEIKSEITVLVVF